MSLNNGTDFGTCPEDEALFEDATKGNQQAGKIVLIFCLVYLTVFQIWYIVRSRESEYLRHRFIEWAHVISVGAYMQVLILVGREAYGRSRFPCVVTRQLITTFVVFMAVPVYIRACLFYFKIRLNQKLADLAFANAATDSDMNYNGIAGEIGWELEDKSFTFTQRREKARDNRVSSLGDESEGSNSFYNSTRPSVRTTHSKSEFSRLLYLTSSRRFGYHAFSLGLIAGLINAGIISRDVADCSGCDVRLKDLIFILIIGGVVIPPINYIFWTIRNEPDPLHLKWEFGYILMFVASPLTMAWAILQFLDPNNLNQDGLISWHYAWILSCMICWSGIFPYQIYRSYKAEWEKNTYKQNGDETLETILSSDIGRQLFKTHSVNEMSLENLVFWREGRRWKATYKKTKPKKRLAKLREIFHTFIESGSPLEVNLSGELKDTIRKAVSEDNEDAINVDANTLDECLNVSYSLMARDTFPRFLQSDLYAEFKNKSNYMAAADPASGFDEIRPSI